MKKLAALCLAAVLLAGCAQGAQPTPPPATAAPTPTEEPAPAPTLDPAATPAPTGQLVPGYTYDVGLEGDPPVLKAFLEAAAVPDFLGEEQRALYLRADTIFPIFCGVPDAVDTFPKQDGSFRVGPCIRQIDGLAHCRAWNRYEAWDDFVGMLQSVFTEEYTRYLLEHSPFCNVDGILYYGTGAAGGDPGYHAGIMPDTFELIERTEDAVEFYRVAHYLYERDAAGELLTDKYEIQRFCIRMERVEGEWRVAKFADPIHPVFME